MAASTYTPRHVRPTEQRRPVRPGATPVRRRSGSRVAAPPEGDRHLMRAAINLLLTTGGTAALGMIGLYLTARWYRPAAVGQGNSLVSAMMMIGLVAQLNLASGLPKFLAHSGTRSAALVRTCYIATIGLGTILAVGFVLLAPVASPEYAFLHHGWTGLWLILGCSVWGVFSLQDAVLTGLRATQWVLVENLVFGVLKLVALWWFVPGGSSGVLLAWVMPVLIAVVPVNILLFSRLLPAHGRLPSTGEAVSSGELRRFVGYDFVGLIFAQAYTALIPLLVLGHYGAVVAASFSVTWSVAFNLDMVAHNLASSLTVEGSRNPERLDGYTRRMLMVGVALVLAATAVLWLVAPLLPRVLGGQYRSAATLLPILVLANLPRLMVYLYHARLRALGRARAVAINQAVVGCLTVLAAESAAFLGYGATGVAWACLVGPGIMAVFVAPQLVRSSPRRLGQGPGRRVNRH